MRELYSALLRLQMTRGRLLATASVGAVMTLVGLFLGLATGVDHLRAGHDLVNNLGLGLLVPAVSLLFACATLGDLVDDNTLVYLWVRPVATWKLVATGMLVALTAVLPQTVVAMCVAAFLSGGGLGLVLGAAAATVLSVAGYSGLFLALGLLVRRALAWGFLYVLVWEGVIANIGAGPSRLSVHLYARSVLESLDGETASRGAVGPGIAVPVVLGLAFLALALGAARLGRSEIA